MQLSSKPPPVTTGVRVVFIGGRLEHSRARRLGADRAVARARKRTDPLALGLWRHLFSVEPAGRDRRRSPRDPESGLRDDAGRGGRIAGAIEGGSDAPRIGAPDVLVVADGAVWIWNLVGDRFAAARQRLDLATPVSTCGRWHGRCTPPTKGQRGRGGSRCRPSFAAMRAWRSSRT